MSHPVSLLPLSYEELYRAEIRPYTKLSLSEERQLVELARTGDRQAKERLLCSLLNPIRNFAWRFAGQHRGQSTVFSELEFAAVGNLVLVEKFDEALTKENPCAWLLNYAYGQIKQYRLRFRSIIATPVNYLGDVDLLESLDAYLAADANGDPFKEPAIVATLTQVQSSTTVVDTTSLYAALETLSQDSQALLYRLFGLHGHGEETLKEIVGKDSTSQEYKTAMSRKGHVIKVLRKALATHYPRYANATGRGAPKTYERVRLNPNQRARLDQAIATLQGRGEKLTVKRIQAECRLNSAFICAYLHERKAS